MVPIVPLTQSSALAKVGSEKLKTVITCTCVCRTAETAERSGARQIDDWLCPTPYRQTATSTRRRSGLLATAAVDRTVAGQRHRSTADVGVSGGGVDPADDDDDGLTIDLLLLTLGVLLVLLLVVGLASYCRAVRS